MSVSLSTTLLAASKRNGCPKGVIIDGDRNIDINILYHTRSLFQRGSREQPCLTYEIDLYKYCHTLYEGSTHFKPN